MSPSDSSPPKLDDLLAGIADGPAPEPDEVRAQVERIRNSEAFARSLRIQKLLEFLVASVLAGQQDRLKEAIIGIEVFERSAGYDSKIDPIVRVEMRRIRSKLSEYYLTQGRSDDVLIWLDKGSYVPLLAKRAQGMPAPETGASTDTPLPAVPEIVLANTGRYRWLAAGLAALLATVAISLYLKRPPRISHSLRLFPLTGNPGSETSPAFSPDGQQIAYSWDGNGRNLDIYVKPLNGSAPRRLTDNAAHDIHPAWSPDGRRMAFLRISPERSQLLVMPSTSGVETVIGESAPSFVRWHPDGPEGVGGSGPVWSLDGSYLLIARNAGAAPVIESRLPTSADTRRH